MGLKFPNWLPIAISFNNFSHCRITIWKDAEMFAAYAICTRIIASAYTLELREARRRMSSILAVVKEVKDGIESKSLATDVIVGTVRHIARRMKKEKPSVDSFVLFVDECANLIEDSQFSNPSDSCPHDHFRDTILGMEVGKELKTSLLMSSDSIAAVFKSKSSRKIEHPD